MSNKKTFHLRTDVKDKKPSSGILDHGAIAINYNNESPTIFIKDTADSIVEFKDKKYFENIIEENELVVATALTSIKNSVGLGEDGSYAPQNGNIINNASTISEATILLDNAISELNDTVNDLTDDISEKQEKLISGTNIKTINNTSLLGSGNIEIEIPNDVYVWNFDGDFEIGSTGTITSEVYEKIKSANSVILNVTSNGNSQFINSTSKLDLTSYMMVNFNIVTTDEINSLIVFIQAADNSYSIEGDIKQITDTKVTSVENHYLPSEDSNAELNASSNTLIDITNSTDGVQVVTGLMRDAAGHVVGLKSTSLTSTNDKTLINITYSELVTLRNESQLQPGCWYRITDYITTTSQENTISAVHQFDVLVLATDVNVLSEEARAIKHEGDTYFDNSSLNAWQIWYCLDNDSDRFGWSDTSNGKGVIYRLIDEYGNDCPYDFKNIKFIPHTNSTSGSGGSGGASNIAVGDFDTDVTDISNDEMNEELTELLNASEMTYYYTFDLNAESDYSMGSNCYNNIIKPYYVDGIMLLNFITFKNTSDDIECHSNSFGYGCYGNSFDSNCYNNTFGNYCSYNMFMNSCYLNSFMGNCQNNILNDNCVYNSFGFDCCYNSFNTSCQGNILGNNCQNNTLDNTCRDNSFGNYCNNNSFSVNCNANSIGNECESNILMPNSRYNLFGNKCAFNYLGESNFSNSFGNECDDNQLGNNCHANSFGNKCCHNSFVYQPYISHDLLNGCYYNKFENGVEYVKLYSDIPSQPHLKNVLVCHGVSGTEESNTYVEITQLGAEYQIKVAKNSKGDVKVYCEADLIQ